MKITAITQQAKRADRYSIFVDDRYAFSLSESALLTEQLAPRQEINKQQLEALKKASLEDKVYGNALRYAVFRPRSVWEMETYLRRKNAEGPLTQRILDKLLSIGLLDDVAFSQAWIQNRRTLKNVSRRRLIQELRQKHVADDVVQQVLAEDTTDDLKTLQQLIELKRRQLKYQDNIKLMQYLARQGFNYNDIKKAIEED